MNTLPGELLGGRARAMGTGWSQDAAPHTRMTESVSATTASMNAACAVLDCCRLVHLRKPGIISSTSSSRLRDLVSLNMQSRLVLPGPNAILGSEAARLLTSCRQSSMLPCAQTVRVVSMHQV